MDLAERLGPNADDVLALLEDLDQLRVAEVLHLSAARWGMTVERGSGGANWIDLDERRKAARARLLELARRHGRMDALLAVGDEVAAWSTNPAWWLPSAVVGGGPLADGLPPRMAATPPILDAAYATVMEDLLTDDETDLLCAPWDEVVPEADEAVPEDEDAAEADAADDLADDLAAEDAADPGVDVEPDW